MRAHSPRTHNASTGRRMRPHGATMSQCERIGARRGARRPRPMGRLSSCRACRSTTGPCSTAAVGLRRERSATFRRLCVRSPTVKERTAAERAMDPCGLDEGVRTRVARRVMRRASDRIGGRWRWRRGIGRRQRWRSCSARRHSELCERIILHSLQDGATKKL